MRNDQLFSKRNHVNLDDLMTVTPYLLTLFAGFVAYCDQRNLPVEITSIKDEVSIRKTSTHRDGRAIDISTIGWSEHQINEAVKYINKEFKDIGAISSKDGKVRALVYHIGTGPHFHLQVRRK